MSEIKRPVARVNRDRQIPLFDEPPVPAPRPSSSAHTLAARFVEPDPSELRVGTLPVSEHLRQMGVKEPLHVQKLLASMDWTAFESAYTGGGRPPYAPRLMTGIILYGLMKGISSLRELARFARTDLGCMWVSGGIAPDYSILGRFIQRHAALFQGDFFEALTEKVLKRTGSGRERLAGDGTVLEAVTSRFSLLSREATEAKAEQARAQQTASSWQAPAKPQAYERLIESFEAHPRAKALSPLEPDACLLYLKNRRGSRLGYEAAVLANEARVVVDAAMHPTSEQEAMLMMLDRLQGAGELLLDAGFNNFKLIEKTLNKGLSLLCPERASPARRGNQALIPASEFSYDPEQDCYFCPQGERLTPSRRCAANEKAQRRAYVQYSTPACRTCPIKDRCTSSRQRVIKRTNGLEYKEALRTVMKQPQARRISAKRKAMVEPVFSHLRERQRLNRFRRRGLKGVNLELRLHLMAYNLSRAVHAALLWFFCWAWLSLGRNTPVVIAQKVRPIERYVIRRRVAKLCQGELAPKCYLRNGVLQHPLKLRLH